jgi:hypothetical protein
MKGALLSAWHGQHAPGQLLGQTVLHPSQIYAQQEVDYTKALIIIALGSDLCLASIAHVKKRPKAERKGEVGLGGRRIEVLFQLKC